MKTVHVSASRDYDIIIGRGLIATASNYVCNVKKACKTVIITNDTVAPLFADSLRDSLIHAGYQVLIYQIRDGECYKNTGTYLEILNFLAENQVTRSDLIIALGGGVVGDMAGFAAATYLRGIDYIQVPTTLLAMVDSSVGGKTAIDLAQGKNLVGAFYQPILVLCDLDALNTLPAHIFIDGCAEVIKYGMLYDKELLEHLAACGRNFDQEYVIPRCVEWKRDVVCQDEYDTGARQKLNLGHTIGHAIEKVSNFSISHGQAVAMGMAIVTKAASQNRICDKTVYEQLISVLNNFALPITAPQSAQYCAEELFKSALSDKKRTGSTVNLIVPTAIGNCTIQKTDIAQLQAFIESGL